ncbi:MAG TPA: hypothetical protein VGJ20_39495 [Xanthobacteraceae bacterium]|jgi:hypothetical protein
MTRFERDQLLFDITKHHQIPTYNVEEKMNTPDPPHEEPGEHEPDAEEPEDHPEDEEGGAVAAAWRV